MATDERMLQAQYIAHKILSNIVERDLFRGWWSRISDDEKIDVYADLVLTIYKELTR